MKTVSNTHKPDRPRSAFCEECGLSYVQSPSDRRIHRKYHAETVYGVEAPSTTRVIWWEDGCEVSVVVPSSPIERKRYAEKVARVARRRTPFDWPAYIAGDGPGECEGYAFMLHREGRTIGLLVVGKGSHIWPCTWAQYNDPDAKLVKLPDDGYSVWPPLWSVFYIWIAPAHRRKGLTWPLLDCASCFLGMVPHGFGCCPPFTELGEMWARRTWPDSFYIIK